jgi:hypothetical protein
MAVRLSHADTNPSCQEPKKADYVPESQIDALKDNYNAWHIYFPKMDTRTIAKVAE